MTQLDEKARAALLARAARYLRGECEPWTLSFRLDGDEYDHDATFEWPGRLFVLWNGEVQCRSAAGDLRQLGSPDAELEEAGIDWHRALALLDAAELAFSRRAPSMQRQLPGVIGAPAYLAEFRWPGVVRVFDFRTRELLVQSEPGEPTNAERIGHQIPLALVDAASEYAARDSIDAAEVAAGKARLLALRDALAARQEGKS